MGVPTTGNTSVSCARVHSLLPATLDMHAHTAVSRVGTARSEVDDAFVATLPRCSAAS